MSARARHLRTRACAALAVLLVAVPVAAGPPLSHPLESLVAATPGLDAKVLGLALRASACARSQGALPESDLLTVIDYSRPSTEPRLYVLDVTRGALLHRELVAHGKYSGANRTRLFSNEPGSRRSSIGLFVTRDTYVGRHGRSLRLDGLEPGVNDRALERAIVVHGASYVGPRFIAKHGRLGRSWGCPALAPEVAQRVIDVIRDGTPVFAYYPDRDWLARSPYLGCKEADTSRPTRASAEGGRSEPKASEGPPRSRAKPSEGRQPERERSASAKARQVAGES